MCTVTPRYPFRADLLRAELARRQIRQETLARQIGTRLGTVSRWCRGVTEPRGWELVGLVDALGLPAGRWYEPHDEQESAA